MTRNGLTLTIVMRAESANYGEGIGNIAVLKKVSRGDHNQYSYISRQALRYNIVQQLKWDNTPVSDQGVVQFAPNASIDDYPEIDLFGYFKTEGKSNSGENGKKKTRSAVARLSNAIALEPFNGDFDFLTNMGLACRGKNLKNVIAQSEIQASFYSYTLSVDLDLVGVDRVYNGKDYDVIQIDDSKKADRVTKLLDVVQFLYRDIKGRRENLAPLFAIGGIYERKNPYFEHRVLIKNNEVLIAPILETRECCEDVQKHTRCGVLSSIFTNDEEIKRELNATTVAEFFKYLKDQVEAYYNG